MARGYRNAVIKPARKDPNHPINHGFKMQVHHLLSKQGVGNTKSGPLLKKYGFNINLPGNLVALPCTLEGACHLKVQLHRGEHPKAVDTNDDDGEHPNSYHAAVRKLVKDAVKTIKKRCSTDHNPGVQRYMDYHSLLILRRIKNFELPLTKVAKAFEPDGVGCLGATTVPELTEKLKKKPSECQCDGRIHGKFNSFTMLPYNLERGK